MAGVRRWLLPRAVARAWLKGAVRRPLRAVVVVVTLAVMTVGIAGTLIAGDSLDQLFVADARALWGDVDVEVTSGKGGTFDESAARVIGEEVVTETRARAPRLILRGMVESGGNRDADAVVLGLGPEERTLDPLRSIEGTADFLRLDVDEVVLNHRMARRIDAAVGEEVSIVVAVPEILEDQPGSDIPLRHAPKAVEFTATVAGVVADTGVADLGRTPNVLLRRDLLQRVTELEGLVTHLHLATSADADDLIRTIGPLLRLDDLVAASVAEDALEIAEDEGGQFRSILLTLAALVVAAAMVATTQMLIALAEDRSREIGVLRALGQPGRTIIRVVTVESLAYSLVGGAIGLLLAVPVAEFLATRLSDHFAALSAGRGREQVALTPLIEPATLVTAAILVAVAGALSGRSAGRRLAAVEPHELLRGPLVDLPQGALSARRPVIVALIGSFLLGVGSMGGAAADALRYMGLSLLLTAWWLYRRRVSADRTKLDRRVAVGGLAWATLGAGALADFSQGYETGFAILVVAGVITISSITVLLSGRLRAVVGWIRAYAPRGRWQVTLRTAGAYAEASRGRSGRLVATFGIVLFVAAALEILGSATAIDPDRQSGGFDVMAQSAAGMENLRVGDIEGWGGGAAVPATLIPEDRFGTAAPEDDAVVRLRYPVRMVAVTPTLVASQQFGLAEGDYDSAVEALDAVQRDLNKAVVDRYARPPGANIGDDVVIDLGLGPRRYELVGVLDTFLMGAVFVSGDEYVDLVASSGSILLLGRAADGTTPEELAGAVDAWGRDVGISAETMDEVAGDVVSVNRTFTDTFALMLLLGLVVALVAVAAMLVRSARERRPYLAVLRAIGLRRRTVVATLAAEPIAVALIGALAGLAGGLMVLRALFAFGFSDLAFIVDWTRALAILGGLVLLLVTVCVVSAWPAVPRDLDGSLREIA